MGKCVLSFFRIAVPLSNIEVLNGSFLFPLIRNKTTDITKSLPSRIACKNNFRQQHLRFELHYCCISSTAFYLYVLTLFECAGKLNE